MFATSEDMAARGRHLQGGGPLRLINSGRLEPMKGAQDLVPVAAALRDRGARFTLDIYGTGSLEDRIRQEIVSRDLGDLVTLHAPVDFETELVPISRTGADLFLSCHRQSDPSCTYLEAMGCGLALAGYDNQMLTGLLRASGGGWSVPTGNVDALAARIATIAAGPDDLLSAMRQGLEFATGHGFFDEFTRRNEHMMSVVGAVALPVPSEPG